MSWKKVLLFIGLPLVAALAALYVFAQYDADFLWFQTFRFCQRFYNHFSGKVSDFCSLFPPVFPGRGRECLYRRKRRSQVPTRQDPFRKSPGEVIDSLFHDRRQFYIWVFLLVCATLLWTKLLVFTSLVLGFGLLGAASIHLVNKKRVYAQSVEAGASQSPASSPDILRLEKRVTCLWALIIVFLSGLMGMRAFNAWMPFLKFIHQSPFGVAEPIFSKDAGFYVYSLPVYNFLVRWCSLALWLIAGIVGFSYYLDQAVGRAKKTASYPFPGESAPGGAGRAGGADRGRVVQAQDVRPDVFQYRCRTRRRLCRYSRAIAGLLGAHGHLPSAVPFALRLCRFLKNGSGRHA